MTREQHLQFCKKCTNREMDLKQGLICSLTNEKANFINDCPSFVQDPNYKDRFDDQEELDPNVARTLMDEKILSKLQTEQNYPLGVIISAMVGVLGALLWGVITVITEFQIGFMALAIGAAVGFAMRYAGKGVDQIFGVTGGVIAIVSCLLGNFFSIVGFIANTENLGYLDTLAMFDYSILPSVMQETFSAMDLLFYGIAGYEGYKFSFRAFTEKELAELQEGK